MQSYEHIYTCVALLRAYEVLFAIVYCGLRRIAWRMLRTIVVLSP